MFSCNNGTPIALAPLYYVSCFITNPMYQKVSENTGNSVHVNAPIVHFGTSYQ